ncbi:MAG: hypothetical protein WBN16_05200 [Lutimonas sp.]
MTTKIILDPNFEELATLRQLQNFNGSCGVLVPVKFMRHGFNPL